MSKSKLSTVGIQVKFINPQLRREQEIIFQCRKDTTVEKILDIEREIPLWVKAEIIHIEDIDNIVAVGMRMRNAIMLGLEHKDKEEGEVGFKSKPPQEEKK